MVDDLSNKYNGIPPPLRKIEELVSGTNTGKAPALAPYYQHWEALLFSALTAFVLASMRKLLLLFNPRHGSHSASTDRPLFQVKQSLHETAPQASADTASKLKPGLEPALTTAFASGFMRRGHESDGIVMLDHLSPEVVLTG